MSSGGRSGWGNKSTRGEWGNIGSSTTHKDGSSHRTEASTTDKDKDSTTHKITPTAEQLRIAQMIDNKRSEPDKVLQEKINQVMQITGVNSDDALVALHDCDNDVNAAIDSVLEGDDQGEWRESSKKKKKVPTTKNVELESNKENRRVENRERSGSRSRGGPPRYRGRGAGRGGRDTNGGDGPGRGDGSRRGRMFNGTSTSRGRGSRGRGSSLGPRTFQNRQQLGFTEAIDTWEVTADKLDQQNSLTIDTWDMEQSQSTEDWDEWTGSLDQTTVFCPSTMQVGSLSEPQPDTLGMVGQVATSPPPTQSYSTATASTSTLMQSQAMDLAALLQKAAPHSTLEGLPAVPQLGNSVSTGSSATGASLGAGQLGSSSVVTLGSPGQHDIFSGLSPNVGETLKSSGLVGSVVPSGISSCQVPPAPSFSSPSAPIQNSIFSSGLHNSVSSSLTSSMDISSGGNSSASTTCSSSISTSSALNKPPSIPSQNSALPARSKTPRSRLPHSTKIPLSAVEMPEDAMAALEMEFTGLEFGGEALDFTADVKSSSSGVGLSPNAANSQDAIATTTITKDLTVSSLPSLSQSQKVNLGPEPLLYPSSQTSDRKPSSSAFVSGGQRSSVHGTSAQGLADLSKKESGASSGGLGSLVAAQPPSPYQPSYASSKSSSSFPSPPSAPYTHTPSQNSYSASSQAAINSGSGYHGSSVTGSSNANNSSNNSSSNSSQTTGGFSSSFSVQVSSGGAGNHYQNSYANASSHSSLASISAPKQLTSLKDGPSMSYSESTTSTGAGLASSLTTSATGTGPVGVVTSTSTPAGHPASLNTVASHSSQPAKALTVSGKGVGLSSTAPPGVHQAHHIQQHTPQHQQQQAHQQQQMLAQPSQYMPPPAALQGTALPAAFYTGLQQPAMYSFEDLQLLQQRMPHLQQPPTTLTAGRDGSITSAAYSVADGKYRNDQNSSPVPSTINQQGATGGGTYITTGNATIPPYFMYHNVNVTPVASSFPQYPPTAIIVPPNTHTGSNTTQFPGPKLQYGSANYYDNLSQTQEFKAPYGAASQGQNKAGAGTAGTTSNSATDLTAYKNHLGKVNRTYDKQGFHTPPPPYSLTGSGTNPMPANAYPHMFIPTMPATQHPNPLMHHQLHPDGTGSGGQRSGSTAGQNKSGSKPYPNASYWPTN